MLEVNISRFVFFLILPVLVSIPDWFEIPIAADEFWGNAGACQTSRSPTRRSQFEWCQTNQPLAGGLSLLSGDDYSDSPEETWDIP